jgi:hypothetical protein
MVPTYTLSIPSVRSAPTRTVLLSSPVDPIVVSDHTAAVDETLSVMGAERVSAPLLPFTVNP